MNTIEGQSSEFADSTRLFYRYKELLERAQGYFNEREEGHRAIIIHQIAVEEKIDDITVKRLIENYLMWNINRHNLSTNIDSTVES